MLARLFRRIGVAYVEFLGHGVAGASRHPWPVLFGALLLTAGSLWYAGTHFAVNTDMNSLLSQKLAFQRQRTAFVNAFPQLSDTIVAVVDGETPGLAGQASERLASWARKHGGDYRSVYEPGGGSFFRHSALLYLSPKQLNQLSDRLARAQPLVASLSSNPTLPGLFDLLGQAVRRRARGEENLPGLDQALQEVAKTTRAAAHGQFRVVNWQALMAGNGGSPLQGTRRFVIIKPHFDYQSIQPAAKPIAHLRQAIRTLHLTAAHGVRVRLTGSAVLDNDQLQAVSSGVGLSLGLSLGLVLLLLIAGLRSWRHVLASVITLVTGLVWTTAFGLLAVGAFNLLSVAFAVLFVGLGVDFSIQFCMRHREVLRETGAPRSLTRTALGIGGALTLAAVAAAASFYSVVPTSYAGLVDLGLISGTSMFIALLNSLFLLPALLTVLGAWRVSAPRRAFYPFARFRLHRYGRAITLLATALGIAAIPVLLGTHFDFNPLDLQNPHSEAVSTLRDLMRDSRFTPYSMDVLEPNLGAARKAAQSLDKLPSVSRTVTLDSFIPKNQDAKLPIVRSMALIIPPFSLEPATRAQPPPPQALAAAVHKLRATLASAGGGDGAARGLQHALAAYVRQAGDGGPALRRLQQRLLATLPYQLRQLRDALRAQRVTRADLPRDVVRRYVTPDGRARVEVYSSLDMHDNRDMRRFVHDVHSVAPGATGTPALLVAGGDAVVHSFEQATLTSAVAIALLLWVVLGRWLDVFLVLLPLPLAAILTGATMRLAGLSLNLSNIIVLPLLIGLGVAYGIYFVVRWREGIDLDRVMRSSTPEAILFSALTTVASFGSLAAANSFAMKALGETLSIALGYVLLSSLVVLPALLTVIPHMPLVGNGQGRR
ncbi:MAG TPA: MMPL family transporter [Gammaproteobacteria bacterium]|nr:MMPL family transporter [Gammaproteobacteria bacterium]